MGTAVAPAPGTRRPEDRARPRLVVVGNGMAGARAVEEILQRSGPGAFRVTMFGDEPYGNYNRILLSGVLTGTDDAADIFLNPLDWYRANGIVLHAGVRVARIDRWARVVHGADGTVEHYDRLIIATGSRTRFPPIEGLVDAGGAPRPGVFGFRSLDDCHAILAHAEGARRAVVIGGGLLGLEAARGLLEQGLEVHVLHRGAHLMNQQLDGRGGAILRRSVETMGVTVHLRADTRRVLGEGSVTGVELTDGRRLDADLVVVAAGTRPNAEIGAAAGLTVERAIVVDDQMRSIDDPDVYVVGECAQHRGQVYGLVAPVWEQARVLADHLTAHDARAAYHGSRLVTKLKVLGVELASMGVVEPERDDDEHVQFAEPARGVYKTLVLRDGRLIGATLLGDLRKLALLTQAFERRDVLPEDRASLLFDIGAADDARSLADLAEGAQVCNCNGVTKGDLLACVNDGVTTVAGVMAHTRAGMGCGSCKGLVGDLVGWAAGDALQDDPASHWYVPGVPLTKPELVEAVTRLGLRSVSAVFAALTGGQEDPGSKMGLASLLKTVWGADYEDDRDARFINDRVHANIQKDGTFSVIPRMAGGVTDADQLRRIADVADKYRVPMIKLTGGQRIDLLGVRKEDLPAVWADLGMMAGHAWGKTFRTCKTCVGSEFCRYGLGDSTALGIAIEMALRGIESPGKLKLAVAGCPRNCSEALVKDVGVVAVEGGRWEVYVGGAAGAHVRKGDLLCTLDDPDEVLRITKRFIQHYRENARWLERTYDYVPRVGLERIRAVVVDDAEGDAARLDAAIDVAIEAYVDPWTEGTAPVTPHQFSGIVGRAP